MKLILLCIASALWMYNASPIPDKNVGLLEHNYVRDDHGQFAFNYLTADGVARTEQGSLQPNKEGTHNVLVQRGSYSYYAPDGQKLTG